MQVLKEDVRRNIKDAAVMCFKQVGYDKASMRQIASSANLSVGNLYRYFPNKEALFDYCVQPAVDFFQEGMKKHDREMPPPFMDVNLLEEIELVSSIIEARMFDRDALFLMLVRNQGSKYEGAKQEFVDFVYEKSKEFMKREFKDSQPYMDDGLYRKAAATAFVEGFMVLLEEAPDDKSFIRSIIQYIELQVRAVMRYLLDIRDNKIEFRRIDHEEVYRHFSSDCSNRSAGCSENNG